MIIKKTRAAAGVVRRATGGRAARAAAVLACAWTTAAMGGGWFAPGGAPESALEKAHAAYLQRDYAGVTGAVRDVFADPATDSVVRDNALSLLSQAFAAANGHLPADWQLPAGVSNLKFKESRNDRPDGVSYSIKLQANLARADAVAQVQLVQYPSRVLLDRRAGVGDWTVDREADGGFSFDLDTEAGAQPLADGLYLLVIETADGQRTDGWFLLSDLAASAAPPVSAPAVGATLASRNPVVLWDDFRTPEYKGYERRVLALNVGMVPKAGDAWRTSWELYETDPTRTQASIGREAAASGVRELANGKYWVTVAYQEQRTFGPLKLRRGARTGRYFYVNAGD